MNKPLTFKTPGGEDLVILPRAEYDDLVHKAELFGRMSGKEVVADEDREDAALSGMARAARARAAGGRAVRLPLDVAMAIADGTSALKAIRSWRGLTQIQLAEKAGTDQGMISALEAGRRRGAGSVWRAIATALDVPMETVMPPATAPEAG